jgi:hypothetical protein
MADIPQVLANYDALVGVALGAGLTYGFGALNRRHHEAREDKTRCGMKPGARPTQGSSLQRQGFPVS